MLPLAPGPLQAQRPRLRYVDGLCIPGEWPELSQCGFSAVVIDVSSGAMETLPDGTSRYRRNYEPCLKSIVAFTKALPEKVPGAFVALKGSEIPASPDAKRLAVFCQVQGGDFVIKDLARIDVLHALGLRVLQFTHHFGNTLAGGCMDVPQAGLTPFGREALKHMEELRILPDLAHASGQTGLDVVQAARRPVIVSHGACRAIVNNARCTSDEVIRGLAERGGMMGMFMMSFWLTEDEVPKVDHLIAQIRHVIKVGGIDAVGIANDYAPGGEPGLRQLGNDNAKGIPNYMPWWLQMRKLGVAGFDRTPQHVVIPELNDPRRMFTIHAALERAGFRDAEIEKIMGGNWIRVLQDSLG